MMFSLLFNCVESYSQNSKDTLYYLFLGHTYEWFSGGSKVDSRLEELDYSEFDRIWLGGDVCSESLLEYSTVQYIDSLFNISAPGNHWALGNHDTRNGNMEWYYEFTGRKSYYSHYQDGITTIVMNTCIVPYDCENLDKQFRMIENVCDTIKNSSWLILLMHHGIWNNIPGLPDPILYTHTYSPFWNANCFYKENNSFAGAIYPLLIKVHEKGIPVCCILGDMGATEKSFYTISHDGIHFIGSGINNSFYADPADRKIRAKDKVLVFEHILSEQSLIWRFYDLDSLNYFF